ncbi:MAG: phosphotransferase [Burkholderiaceae bacterium]
MSARIEFSEHVVRKRFRCARHAAVSARRSCALRRAGLRTPACQVDPENPHDLRFERIAGRAPTPAEMMASPTVLERAMALLAQLHRLAPATMPDLPVFDPLLRIRPRLAARGETWMSAVLAAAGPPTGHRGDPGVVVHGDLHAGQFLLDDSGSLWLLDLDDLAHGSPESDLGNFAAHLATAAGVPGRGHREPFEATLALVCDAYARQSPDVGIDRCRLGAYARLALLRRALKLAERGDTELMTRLQDWLSH